MSSLTLRSNCRTSQSYRGNSQGCPLELFSVHLTIWISALRTIIPPCIKGVTCCLDSICHSVLNKSHCLNNLLTYQQSDAIMGKLRHPSIFKLPHVRTTRFMTSLVNYAIDLARVFARARCLSVHPSLSRAGRPVVA